MDQNSIAEVDVDRQFCTAVIAGLTVNVIDILTILRMWCLQNIYSHNSEVLNLCQTKSTHYCLDVFLGSERIYYNYYYYSNFNGHIVFSRFL